jgi:hypothetical protein
VLHRLFRAGVVVAPALAFLFGSAHAQSVLPGAPAVRRAVEVPCTAWAPETMRRNPTVAELRCRFGILGSGRFGLADYMDVPVYQPATPLPGTHVVGLPGFPGPRRGESHEEWEWRMLRMHFPAPVRQVHRSLDLLDPLFAGRLIHLEDQLRAAGVRFARRETWRSPERQAYLFQQGRSRPGGIVTSTLTSFHSRVDERGAPAGRAADYDVPRSQMPLFHEIVWGVGLESYGADSNDPGHVYLEGAERVPESELAFLRLLPRVPPVSMTTGRPSDEPVTRELRDVYRRLAMEWAYEPFFRAPLPGLAYQWAEPILARAAPSARATRAPHPTRDTLILRIIRRLAGRPPAE